MGDRDPFARSAALPSRPLRAAGMQMLTGSVALLVGGVATGELGEVRLEDTTLESGLAFVYLVFIGGILAFTCYQWLPWNTRTSLVATYAYVNPVVAVALGWAWLDEAVTVATLLAGGIVLAAVALIVSAGSAPAPEPARSTPEAPSESEDRSRAEAATRGTSHPRPRLRAAPAPSGQSPPR